MGRVISVFQNRAVSLRIREMVEGAGLARVLVCDSAAKARRFLAVEAVDVVICGFALPGGSAQELLCDLPGSCSMLLIASQAQLELYPLGNVLRLTAPVSRKELLAAVETLLQLNRGAQSPAKPLRSEDEQVVIRQAKAILMERWGMTEGEAHRFLQKKSMDARVKMSQTAQLIVDME